MDEADAQTATEAIVSDPLLPLPASSRCVVPRTGHRSPRVPVSCAPVGSGLVLADVHVCGHDPLASLPSCPGLREPGSPMPWAGPRKHRPASPPLSQETLRRPCSEKVCGPRWPSLRGASDPGWLAVPPPPRVHAGPPEQVFPSTWLSLPWSRIVLFTALATERAGSHHTRAPGTPQGFAVGEVPRGRTSSPGHRPTPSPRPLPARGSLVP